MATETANPGVASSSAFDLQKLVSEATWRELLISLVESNQIDPWDIDIAKLVEGYMSVVKSIKLMDLRMPANFALAASILLKMKSDRFQIFSVEEEPEPEPEAGQRRLPVDVPGLVSRARMQPQRKVTLDELMGALDEAMKIEKRSTREREPPAQFHLELPKEDIDQKMERTFDLVSKNADKEGIVLFGSLARLYGSTQEMLFDFFIPVLFLVSKGRLGILQEEFFGDIFIKVLGGAGG
jgi:chromatin segregation and condensation protein Rec8/ScpA/Scc1 (kleisin family)